MRIIDYEPRHAEAWRTLNEAWITRWFAIEPKDRKALDDPEGAILAQGGRIFIAEDGEAAVGCVALAPMDDGGYEVAKMTVAEPARGAGLGRRLMQACVEAARAAGAPRLYLETNARLAPALGLYRAFGFREIEGGAAPPSDYQRCDVWMELRLA
ncbi:MAG: GNAT family N-acetyltransferase [Proteobacteria bacterium]|nr:GNAT family N-acetyltransferase [Pseudomonadota bacterium]MBW3617800.1 GNAT family N-acetyltransferase [Pseudomonadota bacterium]